MSPKHATCKSDTSGLPASLSLYRLRENNVDQNTKVDYVGLLDAVDVS
jgi:hypothetical protein